MLADIPQIAKNEEARLTASFVNAIAVAAAIGGVLGPYITALGEMDAQLRLRLFFIGLGLRSAAHSALH